MSTGPQPPPPQPPPPPSPSTETPRGAWTGRVIAGLLLVLFGIAWFLEILDVVEFPWDVVLPSGLILIGVVLLANARSQASQGGLIATGIVLTVVLALGLAVDFPISGGVGERREGPRTSAELREGYRLGVGQLTVDLTDLSQGELSGRAPVRMRARVGIGQLVVVVPEEMPVRVEARAGIGNVQLFGVEGSGLDVQRTVGPGTGETPVVELVLSVGLGQVEVRRG